MTGKAQFSFGELLVLLDVEGAGALTTPMPTPAAAATLTGPPPRTELVVSPGHAVLAITRFADQDIWTNMFEWMTGYLGDTLGQRIARDDYAEYAGQGVCATLAFTRPNVRLDSR